MLGSLPAIVASEAERTTVLSENGPVSPTAPDFPNASDKRAPGSPNRAPAWECSPESADQIPIARPVRNDSSAALASAKTLTPSPPPTSGVVPPAITSSAASRSRAVEVVSSAIKIPLVRSRDPRRCAPRSRRSAAQARASRPRSRWRRAPAGRRRSTARRRPSTRPGIHRRTGVGPARMWVADVGREEFEEADAGALAGGGDERWHELGSRTQRGGFCSARYRCELTRHRPLPPGRCRRHHIATITG